MAHAIDRLFAMPTTTPNLPEVSLFLRSVSRHAYFDGFLPCRTGWWPRL
jgi:hypothetical protein